MSKSLIFAFLMSDVSESLISLKSNERCEQIAQVAHQKWATMSNSLTSLRGNVPMSESLIFVLKTSNSLGKPMSDSQPCL